MKLFNPFKKKPKQRSLELADLIYDESKHKFKIDQPVIARRRSDGVEYEGIVKGISSKEIFIQARDNALLCFWTDEESVRKIE